MSTYAGTTIDAPLVRDRSGEMVAPYAGPQHHWRCNGAGMTNDADPRDRVPVACLVCRPHLQIRPQAAGRRPVVSVDANYRPLD
jgi:hypothetical protein